MLLAMIAIDDKLALETREEEETMQEDDKSRPKERKRLGTGE